MTARDKTTPLTAKSNKETCDEVKPDCAPELAAAAERFARVLRTAPVETARAGQADIRHVLFSDDARLFWTTTLQSQWQRYLCKPRHRSAIH
jgi:hypothetical protein